MIRRTWFHLLITVPMTLSITGCTGGGASPNKLEGDTFLAENAMKPGVLTTLSGLQYQILQEGTGAQPSAKDSVTVNYKGAFIDGSEFDSGESISFPLNGVIAGWTEGLQLMKEGATYRFFIPSQLAYGERGAGRVIPPNATLVFDVQLTKVNR